MTDCDACSGTAKASITWVLQIRIYLSERNLYVSLNVGHLCNAVLDRSL